MATVVRPTTEYIVFDTVDTLDEVPTNTPGWRGLSYTPWYRMGRRVGDNRPIPGAAGRLQVAREIDELKLSQQMRFTGRRDREDTPYADSFEGVIDNLLYFRKHVLDYLPARDVTFHRRGGATSTGSVTIDDWEETVDPESAGDVLLVVVQITVAAGYIVVPA